jgi:phenylalanyl-tRNA synthetase beta chain
MKIPLSWLRELVDVQLTPEQLADALTLRGLEVRAVERWGANWNRMVVGELLEVGPHPRADRLQLTKVRIGKDEILEVVCGARNIAAGQRVPVALVGALMPDGRKIERAEKMGVASEGMLCSGAELDATDDGDGILILDGKAPIGTALGDYLGEDVIDVDVKPNRGDLLSVLGLAREVGAITGAPVKYQARRMTESGAKIQDDLALKVEDSTLAPRVVLRAVDGVRVGAAPDAVQMRLKAAGLRSISNVVDATNYIMLELGKPTHAFDRGAVGTEIRVRLATRGESLETLDHVSRSLDGSDLVIADERGALALAGVMGGASSEVGERTSSVIIESAVFAPTSIRRSAQRHSLRSEASHRFERGQELDLAPIAAEQVAALVSNWAGGSVRRGTLDSDPKAIGSTRGLPFRPERVRSLIGVELSGDAQQALLSAVGIGCVPATAESSVQVTRTRQVKVAKGELLVATIPAWRRDLEFEVDIAEEVARLYGYDQVPATLPGRDLPGYRPQPTALRDRLRSHLAAVGMSEAVTHALVSEALSARHVEPLGLVSGALAESEGAASHTLLTLANPLSADHDRLRRSLLPSLLDRAEANVRYGAQSGALFEVGRGYGGGSSGPQEWTRLAFVAWGEIGAAAPGGTPRHWDLDELKRIISSLAKIAEVAPRYVPPADADSALFHPGRVARVEGDGIAGLVGELHPGAPEWRESPRLILAEVALRGLSAGAPSVRRVSLPPTTPPVQRDVALAAPAEVAVGDLVSLAWESAPLATQIELFDLFSGAGMAAGERSVGLRFTFQPSVAAELDEQIVEQLNRFTSSAGKRFATRVRGAESL